jgi:hypothetical protein
MHCFSACQAKRENEMALENLEQQLAEMKVALATGGDDDEASAPSQQRPRRKSLSEQLWGDVPAKVNSRRPSVSAAPPPQSDSEGIDGEEEGGPPAGAQRERRLSLQGAS